MDSITGDILQYSNGHVVGTWTVVRNAPQVASLCGKPLPYIWPLPSKISQMGNMTLMVMPSKTFFTTTAKSDILAVAFQRYLDLTFPHSYTLLHQKSRDVSPYALTSVVVKVEVDSDDYPQINTDETYQIVVADGQPAMISAVTVYGALRGLETFSQMVVFDYVMDMYTLPDAPWMIEDVPRFPHRGLMIDTGRHFQSIESIKHIIDSLPYTKINVLHIHMADDQSFPLQSISSPLLWKGSYSTQERYLQADITEIVAYAHYRGVRVMVEFDMPAHASAMCAGYPQICPSPACLTPLNVANNATFDLINGLMMEMTGGRPSVPGNPSPGLFKDNFIHLGGDEVNTNCWTSTPSIEAWLKQMNLTPDQAYGYFVDRVARMALAQGHRPVQWSEVFDHFQDKLAKGTIVHIWKPNTNVTQVVALGYNVLIDVGYVEDSWYLDNLDVTWDQSYLNEPCVGVPDSLCPMIFGGHGEMWGETVDASSLQQKVWPKLAAIGERLWSPRSTTVLEPAHSRLEYFRCLLNLRGIAAAPVNNPIAGTPPPNPGSCYLQRR
jgi:hexosaminidase